MSVTQNRHEPNWRLGLNVRDPTFAINKFTVPSGIRFLNREGPDIPCRVMQQALLSPDLNWFLDSFRDSCNALGVQYNGLPWNLAPQYLLIPPDLLYVKCWSPDTGEAETFPAVVSRGAHGTAQIDFSDESRQLQNDNTWSWTPPPGGP